jgi:4-hydroxybenzoate polyprenyltransferase
MKTDKALSKVRSAGPRPPLVQLPSSRELEHSGHELRQKSVTAEEPRSAPVLCVDLDDTLLAGNVLWEQLMLLVRRNPARLVQFGWWVFHGRAYAKTRLSKEVMISPDALPFRSEVVEFLQQEYKSGRQIVLATATEAETARAIADRVGVFSDVLGTNINVNLKGIAKATALVEFFGVGGFDYIGDSRADLAVWRYARSAYVVDRTGTLSEKVSKICRVAHVFRPPRSGLTAFLRALRLHQWSKNLLVFLPTVLAHHLGLVQFLPAIAAFILFGLCASSIYILNDLLDLPSDRLHPWKKYRPFASGQLSIGTGLALFSILLSAALSAGALLLPPGVAGLMCAYAILSIAYSFGLKRLPLIDVFVLSSFYTLRVLVGGIAARVPLSPWFLEFSVFFFFSLAMVKRYAEHLETEEFVVSGKSGRGYFLHDRELLLIFGVGAAFAAIVVFDLYVQSQAVLALYPHPHRLMLLSPLLLYWLAYVWMKAHRGELKEDPVVFALKDSTSYLVAASVLVIVAFSFMR